MWLLLVPTIKQLAAATLHTSNSHVQCPKNRAANVGDVQTRSVANVHKHHAQWDVDQGLVEERGMGIGHLKGAQVLSAFRKKIVV